MCLLHYVSRATPGYADLQHQTREETLIPHGCSCILIEHRSRELQRSLKLPKLADGEIHENKTTNQPTKSVEIVHAAQEEEEQEEELSTASELTHERRDGNADGRILLLRMLKACEQRKDVHKGSQIHVEIIKSGSFEKDVYVGSALVNMYAKCGALTKAQEVFDGLESRNIVSWNSLISGYAQYGHGIKALECFNQLKYEGLSPNAITFSSVLKACVDVKEGQKVHSEILRDGLVEKDIVVGTGLVDMYCNCGSLTEAENVFHGLPNRNIISWNVLIAGYAQHGYFEEALNSFEKMKSGGFSPDAATMVCVLKACGGIGASEKGQEIHSKIVREGLVGRNFVATHALLDMYAKCGSLAKAEHLFHVLPQWDLPSWTALISGYVQHDHAEEALECFEQMQSTGLSPDAVTFSCILKACGSIGAIDKGLQLHTQISRNNLLKTNNVVGTALVDMYAKCGVLEEAEDMFNKLPFRDIVSWNALIRGYTQHGYGQEALECYQRMQVENLSPDAVTLSCSLKACGLLGEVFTGQEIHHEIVKKGLQEMKIAVANALIDMYARCGLLAEAKEVLNRLPNRDAISWGAFIAGQVQHDHREESLNCFQEMQHEGHSPDACTYVSVFKACGSIGAADKGLEIHFQIVKDQLVETDIVVATALIDMYVKCGMLQEAQDVFDELSFCDLVSWNALLSGYAQFGKIGPVLCTFAKMLGKGAKPDTVTFIVMLTVFSHGGLVEEGQRFFETRSRCYDLIPTLEHEICMLDLFGRAGLLEKAVAVMHKVQSSLNLTAWHALLGACYKWEDIELGSWASEHTLQFREEDYADYMSPLKAGKRFRQE